MCYVLILTLVVSIFTFLSPLDGLSSGRCSFCEDEGSKIVHPASGGHYGDSDGFVDLCPSDAHSVVRSHFEGLLDADYT